MTKIYKLNITTTNPSADKEYYFSTKEKAENETERMAVIILKDIKNNKDTGDYYYAEKLGDVAFDVDEIELDIIN